MTASTLLAALIAASTATNGVITVGDTQPFDQVRLYQNPANGTVLTNQSSDGSIDTSSTALVVTGSTAPTGLVFQPNLAVLRNVTSDIKLLVDTPVELTLSVNIAGSLTEMSVQAGKTAVLTLGLIAGIPMIVGAFGFFPVATDGNGIDSGLLLIPNGATESADGEYQRFESIVPTDSFWTAQLLEADWLPALVVQFKVPTFAEIDPQDTESRQSIGIDFSNAIYPDGYTTGIWVRFSIIGSNLYFGAPTTFYTAAPPPADTIVTLTVTSDSISIAYDAVSETIDISVHELAPLFNCAATASSSAGRAVPPLSIKVSALDQA